MTDVAGLLYEDELRKATAEIERLTAENERQFKATTEDQEVIARLLAENGRLRTAVKEACYAMCTMDYEEQKAVAASLQKELAVHQQTNTA